LNKSTKITINYLLGAILSALLLWQVGRQLQQQYGEHGWRLLHTGKKIYLLFCLVLVPLNLAVEAFKWQLLVAHAQKIRFSRALNSVLSGIAFSLVTPNRLGEYPGRLLFLRQQNTPRLVSVSVLGAFAQLIALFSFGLTGLLYYNLRFPGLTAQVALCGTVLVVILLLFIYKKYDWWATRIEKIKWLAQFKTYRAELHAFTYREKAQVILISLARFAVFTGQYFLLLRWFRVDLPLLDGYLLSALFFWAMAVIPTISLAEIGIRAKVALFLFTPFSGNSAGILGATVLLWVVNLALPAIAGSILMLRVRTIR
jgi:hypothetical protein